MQTAGSINLKNVARRLNCYFGRPARPGRAFTLIEVLVVVAIIALLVAILLPSLQRARQRARWTLCLSNLHQISVALHSYQADYRGQPPQWKTYSEQWADGIALWVQGTTGQGHGTRLGMLYPKYVGKNENVFYCSEGAPNALLNKGDGSKNSYSLYPWKNWGTNLGWAYGSYEYRPRYYVAGSQYVWVGARYDKAKTGRLSIAADAFAGSWDAYGPYPAHAPIQNRPQMLYYNVAYMDGSARAVKDFLRSTSAGREFGTRAGLSSQHNPYVNPPRKGGAGTTNVPGEYTPLAPGPACEPLPDDLEKRAAVLKTDHIDRGWTFFDGK